MTFYVYFCRYSDTPLTPGVNLNVFRRIHNHCIMKKIVFLFSVSLALIFASCKKDKTDPDTGGDDPVTPVATHPDGYLKHYQTMNLKSVTAPGVIKYNTKAYFYSSNTASDIVSIDSMSLNNVYLKRATDSTYYSANPVTGSVCTWHVEGKRGIPDFDYKNFPIPGFILNTAIPDSLNLKNDLTISLAGSGNFKTGTFTIYDVVGKNITKEIKPGDASVTYSAAELSTFNKYADFYFYINFINAKTDTISQKAFYFENQVSIDKTVTPH